MNLKVPVAGVMNVSHLSQSVDWPWLNYDHSVVTRYNPQSSLGKNVSSDDWLPVRAVKLNAAGGSPGGSMNFIQQLASFFPSGSEYVSIFKSVSTDTWGMYDYIPAMSHSPAPDASTSAARLILNSRPTDLPRLCSGIAPPGCDYQPPRQREMLVNNSLVNSSAPVFLYPSFRPSNPPRASTVQIISSYSSSVMAKSGAAKAASSSLRQ